MAVATAISMTICASVLKQNFNCRNKAMNHKSPLESPAGFCDGALGRVCDAHYVDNWNIYVGTKSPQNWSRRQDPHDHLP